LSFGKKSLFITCEKQGKQSNTKQIKTRFFFIRSPKSAPVRAST